MRTILVTSLFLLAATAAQADTNGLRVTEIHFTEDGSVSEANSTPGLDVVQDLDCDDDASTPDDEEAFHDVVVSIKVRNTLTSEFRAQRFYYRVNDGTRLFTSRKLAPLNQLVLKKNESGYFRGLFIHQSGGRKYFTSQSTPIDPTLGFQNVRVYIQGIDGRGRRYTLSSRIGTSFSDYDRCE